jgi:two-component system response regulator AtoC
LEDLVRSGVFREDLYFRLKVVELNIPPLRERKGDIPLLADHLLTKIRDKLHNDVGGISPQALLDLESYDWPGNVRELENALTRAAVLARGPVIGVEHLTLEALETGKVAADSAGSPEDSLEAVEAAHVQRVLDRTGGNKRQAARILGISRPRLDRIIEKHDLNTS